MWTSVANVSVQHNVCRFFCKMVQGTSKNISNGFFDHQTTKQRVIDLRSDTLSKLTDKMRKIMSHAAVGDDYYGEDPTVNELSRKCAELFGKESALFVSSGTMGNLLAIMVHCNERGSEVITGSRSHILQLEQAGPACIAGVNIRAVTNHDDGTFDLGEVQRKLRDVNEICHPVTKLICAENTHNYCGGKVIPMEWIQQLSAFAKEHKLALHLDGARIFNALVYSGVSVKEMASYFDSVMICFSKGLGCPVGSMLMGSESFIKRATRFRKVLGGGLRQIGVLAAPAIYSLDHMVQRLTEDHERIRRIADAFRSIDVSYIQVPCDKDIHSNILVLNFTSKEFTAPEFIKRLATITKEEEESIPENLQVKIKVSSIISDDVVRIMTYCNITDDDVTCIIEKIKYVLTESKIKSIKQ